MLGIYPTDLKAYVHTKPACKYFQQLYSQPPKSVQSSQIFWDSKTILKLKPC